jgi:hypothetical protein
MRPFFMSYVRGEDRGQAALLPAAIEDHVAADVAVQVIDAFVEGSTQAGPDLAGRYRRRSDGITARAPTNRSIYGQGDGRGLR